MRQAIALIVFLLLVAGAASIGSIFTPGPWYDALTKPAFNPPKLAFPIAWTLLYIVMAVAAWRVWGKDGIDVALALWLAQLVFNAGWSWIVFGRHQLGWGVAEILVLLVLVVAATIAFFRRDLVAGWLMVPYVAWVAFAAVLNAALWRLNAGG